MIFAAVLLLLAAPNAAGEPSSASQQRVRKGFSFEFGIGYGGIFVAGLDRYGTENRDQGFEPHAISLGGFVSNKLGLFWRWKSTYHNTPNAVGKSAHRFVGTQTLNLQYWFHDRVFVGGGAGVALFGFGFGSHSDDARWSFGFALDYRLGVAVFAWKHHLINVSYEVVSGFFRGGIAVGHTVVLSYQYY